MLRKTYGRGHVGISVILRARRLDLEPLRGFEKALRLTHELGAQGVHTVCMGMQVCHPPLY